MAKGTMLDRLTEAMGTLGKREGKALTPRQRGFEEFPDDFDYMWRY